MNLRINSYSPVNYLVTVHQVSFQFVGCVHLVLVVFFCVCILILCCVPAFGQLCVHMGVCNMDFIATLDYFGGIYLAKYTVRCWGGWSATSVCFLAEQISGNPGTSLGLKNRGALPPGSA